MYSYFTFYYIPNVYLRLKHFKAHKILYYNVIEVQIAQKCLVTIHIVLWTHYIKDN